jgi:hypothetical protein
MHPFLRSAIWLPLLFTFALFFIVVAGAAAIGIRRMSKNAKD